MEILKCELISDFYIRQTNNLLKCDVCCDNNNNEFLQNCQTCNVSIHLKCYGSYQQGTNKQKGQKWNCQRCSDLFEKQSTNINFQCFICQKLKGALKFVHINQKQIWAHVSCIENTPELQFNDIQKTIINVTDEGNFLIRKQNVCKYCTKPMAIKCSEGKCSQTFHITCAVQQGFKPSNILLKWLQNKQTKKVKHYCAQHIGKFIAKVLQQKQSPYNLEETHKIELEQFLKKFPYVPRKISKSKRLNSEDTIYDYDEEIKKKIQTDSPFKSFQDTPILMEKQKQQPVISQLAQENIHIVLDNDKVYKNFPQIDTKSNTPLTQMLPTPNYEMEFFPIPQLMLNNNSHRFMSENFSLDHHFLEDAKLHSKSFNNFDNDWFEL